MNRSRIAVVMFAASLFLVWLILFVRSGALDPAVDRNATVRVVLGIAFPLLILLRPKPDNAKLVAPRWIVPASAVAGTLSAVAGLILTIHQFEWMGLLLILYACLQWALPARCTDDVVLSLFILYWIHPLPGQILSRLELAMQYVSIQGAEWALHCVNMRVWADGFVLRTGMVSIGVPEACSGMKTAVAVLLSALGIGILLRLRLLVLLLLLAAGLAQAIVLNILRIVVTTLITKPGAPAGGDSFFHTSMWAFLFVAIVLVQVEASFLHSFARKQQRKAAALAREEIEPEDKASIFPPVWRMLFKWKYWILAGLIFSIGAVGAVYKRRPYHRSEMIAGVVEQLEDARDFEKAHRAAVDALRLNPSNYLLRAKLARILLFRGLPDGALAELEKTPADSQGVFETVLKAWAEMQKGDSEKAAALVDGLPPQHQDLPGVAMIRAEIAAAQDDAGTCAQNAPKAARSLLMIKRVRSLFPYLAARDQWKAIVECQRNIPYDHPKEAWIAVDALIRVGNIPRAVEVLRRVAGQWPEDVRFLDNLLTMAVQYPGSEMEEMFARSFAANLTRLGPDQLAVSLQSCFELRRPDLAWLAYLRLSAMDPMDPALFMAPAQFGETWFTFRKRQLGLASSNPREQINLKPLYLATRDLWQVDRLWKNVPLAAEMAADPGSKRDEYLRRAMEEIIRRETAGTAPFRIRLMHVTILAMTEQYKEALGLLDGIEKDFPDRKNELTMKRMACLRLQNDSQSLYETAREYLAAMDYPHLQASLMQVDALMHQGMDTAAATIADRTMRCYPDSPPAVLAAITVLDAHGDAEEALFLADRTAQDVPLQTLERWLRRTERFKEADRISEPAKPGQARTRKTERTLQRLMLAPAELSVTGLWPTPLTEAEMDEEAGKARSAAAMSTSPFIRRMNQLTADWLASHGSRTASMPGQWQDAGRDAMEQAMLLNKLTMLLARQNRQEEAAKVAARAVALVPDSAALRRVEIILSNAEQAIAEQAHAACPDDPEIWLAYLVTTCQDKKTEDWAKSEIEKAANERRYSPGTMVRAGNYLYRSGMLRAASAAAHDALNRCKGLLPAYVLGVQCGLAMNDLPWAQSCALTAVKYALDPEPFHRMIVSIQTQMGNINTDLISSLEYLRSHGGTNAGWSERLGAAYFHEGNMQTVLGVMAPFFEYKKGLSVAGLMMVSEAARIEGRPDIALDMIEEAYRQQPDNLDVLNNLVYALAQSPAGVQRALALLPRLLTRQPDSYMFCDTAAVVYLRSGDLKRAKECTERALELIRKGDFAWMDVFLNAAEIDYRLAKYDEGISKANAVLQEPDLSAAAGRRARKLMEALAAGRSQQFEP